MQPMQASIEPLAFHIRSPRPDDAPACGRICYEAFKTIAEKHNFPPDFPSAEAGTGIMSMILNHPRAYGVVAESDGKVLGSNFLWLDTIAGVGPVTVDAAAQNASVGKRLMQEVLEHASRKGVAGVRLVQAAYHSRSLSLYTKLGFVVREPLAVIQGPALNEIIPGYEVRQAEQDDLEACNDLCHRVHGHSRPAEVAEAIQHSTASVVIRNGRVTAYTTTVGFFGHCVAETNDDLKALIGAAREFAGPGFLLPMRNSDLFRWSLEKGLRVIQPMTLMSLGLYNEPDGAFLPSILY